MTENVGNADYVWVVVDNMKMIEIIVNEGGEDPVGSKVV